MRHGHPLALLVAGTFFMENLDATIVTTAAPSIAADLGVTSGEVGVTITAYLLTLAVLIPLSGWLTARLGAHRVFLTAIAVFTIASVLCAVSGSLVELTIWRVLQGVGGAMMVPVGRLAVLRATDKADIIRTFALLTWPGLIAPVIAPLVGGLLTTALSWHWIFLINVPLGIVAFLAAIRLVPRETAVTPARLDGLGLGLVCAGLGLLVLATAVLADVTSGWLVPTALGVTGVALTGWAVAHLLRARHPLLDLRTLRVRTFRLANSAGSVFRLTISAVPFLLPLMFQDVFGWSPVLSGTLVLFVFVGNIAIKPATTGLLLRFGFRTVLVASTLGAALSMVLAALVGRDTPIPVIAALMVFSGVMRSIGFTAYNTIAFADIDQGRMSAANTLTSTLNQVAAGFGVAVGAIALRVGQSVGDVDASAIGPYRLAFLVIAALTVFAAVEAAREPLDIGDAIRPRAT